MKRTPLKRKNSRLRANSSLRRKKKLAEEKIGEDKEKDRMFLFFTSIWISVAFSQRKCESCGKPLTDPIRSYYFDHLIEKSKRPDLALEEENIFLCCLECHALKTSGFPTQAHQKAINKAKEKFYGKADSD